MEPHPNPDTGGKRNTQNIHSLNTGARMLEVLLVNDDTIEVNAAVWHVDEVGGLHLRAANKSAVASFAPNKWLGVISA